MDCSIFSTSLLSIILFFMCLNTVSGTATDFGYGRHCGSVVPESVADDEEFKISPFPARQKGYYSGGGNVLNHSSGQFYYVPASKVVVFETHHVYTTRVEDVFKVEGNLIFPSSYYHQQNFSNHGRSYYSHSSDSSIGETLDFEFHGFWSRATGKLCMVGSGSTYSKEGKLLHLRAVLKLNNIKDSSDINTLITGTMDSLYPADEPNYSDPVSVLMFPEGSYKYTRVSKDFSQGCPGGTDVPKNSSLNLSRTRPICDMFSYGYSAFELEYASGCDSSKSCSPLGDGDRYLPRFMYLSMIQCSDDMLSLRFRIEFTDDTYMRYSSSPNFSTSLIGEGSWDAKKNRLCIVACRIEDASGSSLEKSHVGDCTTRLSLRFPAILSIRNTRTLVGEIWSEKPRNEPGFFDRILAGDTYKNRGQTQLQGLKYEYMETDQVNKSCPKQSIKGNRRSRQYPDGYSADMAFSMTIKGPKGGNGWGSSRSLAVGDQPDQIFPFLIQSSSSRPKSSAVEADAGVSLLNISYQMRIELYNSELFPGIDPYNQSSNGYLEFLLSAEGFYDAETGNLCMVGCRRLRSHNKSIDCDIVVDVHFPPLDSDMEKSEIKGSIKSTRIKTDHLHFEPLEFSGTARYSTWARESIWRMDVEMVICSEEKNKALWIAEKRGLYLCFPVYITGGLIIGTARQHSSSYTEQTILGGSRAYAGLILDAFLFPQIVFNMFLNSKEQALSRFFYIGITLVRLVPHGYDLYRTHNHVNMTDSYIYADPTADYYSTAWDVIIPMLGLFFAAIVYLQQRLGGRCFLPKRFRESVTYDELPVDSEEQSPLKSST
ncbi:hypothetical protein V6N13_129184 [Hibiscus sabdariffa]